MLDLPWRWVESECAARFGNADNMINSRLVINPSLDAASASFHGGAHHADRSRFLPILTMLQWHALSQTCPEKSASRGQVRLP